MTANKPLKDYNATNLSTYKDFNDLFKFRLLIEPWAAEQAAKKIDRKGKVAPKAKIQRAKTALKFKDNELIQALAKYDSCFHSLIADISGNQSIGYLFQLTYCYLHRFQLYMANKLVLGDHANRTESVKDFYEQFYESSSG